MITTLTPIHIKKYKYILLYAYLLDIIIFMYLNYNYSFKRIELQMCVQLALVMERISFFPKMLDSALALD